MSSRIAAPLAGSVIGSTADNFVIAEWQDPGGPPGPPRYIAPLHLHHNDDEAWYVLEGTAGIQNGDEIIEAKPGAAVFVKRGTPHTYWNPSRDRLRYLLIMTPNIYALIPGYSRFAGQDLAVNARSLRQVRFRASLKVSSPFLPGRLRLEVSSSHSSRIPLRAAGRTLAAHSWSFSRTVSLLNIMQIRSENLHGDWLRCDPRHCPRPFPRL